MHKHVRQSPEIDIFDDMFEKLLTHFVSIFKKIFGRVA